MTTPATIKQSDIERIIKAHQKCGVGYGGMRREPDGSIVFLTATDANTIRPNSFDKIDD